MLQGTKTRLKRRGGQGNGLFEKKNKMNYNSSMEEEGSLNKTGGGEMRLKSQGWSKFEKFNVFRWVKNQKNAPGGILGEKRTCDNQLMVGEREDS